MKTVLITGGTGSFGQGFVRMILSDPDVGMVRVYSRDEHKQQSMRGELASDRLSFYVGDVRDKDRLRRAMDGIDWVIHAAALKQAPLGEVEPQEFIKTNVQGSINVAEVALDCNVEKCLLISTDKAVEPINLYGATKMCAERVFLQMDSMRGTKRTRFSLTRYGNVASSRSTIVPIFLALPEDAPTPVTEPEATRFWISLADANAFVLNAIKTMKGGEVLFPRMKSVRVIDVAEAIRPGKPVKIIGPRKGDKTHETLSTEPKRYSSDANEFMTISEIRDNVFASVY